MPLYSDRLYYNVGNFILVRPLVGPGASVNIMSLRTLAYLRINIFKLQVDRVMLKEFNE